MQCDQGAVIEVRRRWTVEETVEEVVYRTERVKHFNREGSEYWADVAMPSLEERVVRRDRVQLVCATCGADWTEDATAEVASMACRRGAPAGAGDVGA